MNILIIFTFKYILYFLVFIFSWYVWPFYKIEIKYSVFQNQCFSFSQLLPVIIGEHFLFVYVCVYYITIFMVIFISDIRNAFSNLMTH